MKVFVATLALAGAALAAPDQAPSYSAPAPGYQQPSYPSRPLNYAFQYGVKTNGPATHVDKLPTVFGHREEAEPKTVTGCYEVLLPDGRYQTVSYTADPVGNGGYVPTITYSTTGGGCGGGYVAPSTPRYNPPPTPPPYIPPPTLPPPTTTTTPKPTPPPVKIKHTIHTEECVGEGAYEKCTKIAKKPVHPDKHHHVEHLHKPANL